MQYMIEMLTGTAMDVCVAVVVALVYEESTLNQ